MADLGEVLLRTLAPIAQSQAADKAAARKQAGAEKVAQIGADSRTAVAGQNKQARVFVALLNAKQSAANLRTKLGAMNDPQALKVKAAIALAGPWMNRLLAGEKPPQDMANAMNFLTDYLEISPEDRSVLQSHGASLGITATPDRDNFMEGIMNNADVQKIISEDPNVANEMGGIFQNYKKIKESVHQATPLKPAEAPGLPSASVPPVPPAPQMERPTNAFPGSFAQPGASAPAAPLQEFSTPEEGEAKTPPGQKFKVIRDGKVQVYQN